MPIVKSSLEAENFVGWFYALLFLHTYLCTPKWQRTVERNREIDETVKLCVREKEINEKW